MFIPRAPSGLPEREASAESNKGPSCKLSNRKPVTREYIKFLPSFTFPRRHARCAYHAQPVQIDGSCCRSYEASTPHTSLLYCAPSAETRRVGLASGHSLLSLSLRLSSLLPSSLSLSLLPQASFSLLSEMDFSANNTKTETNEQRKGQTVK